jgi:hypothetical protein
MYAWRSRERGGEARLDSPASEKPEMGFFVDVSTGGTYNAQVGSARRSEAG